MRDESGRVDGKMTVAALLSRWPGLARAFHRRGMSCPGCAMSRFDALDYVASAYGLARAAWLKQLAREAGRGAGNVRLVTKRRMKHDTD
jgi:hybrid cluster-associated redox disulfide protein